MPAAVVVDADTNYPDPSHPNITDEMLTTAMSTAAGRARVEAQLVGMRARNATLWRIFPQFQDVLAGPQTVNTSGIATLTAALIGRENSARTQNSESCVLRELKLLSAF